MPDDEPQPAASLLDGPINLGRRSPEVSGDHLSPADLRALELFRQAIAEAPRERGPLLVALNAALYRHRLAIVHLAAGGTGRK